MYHLVQDGNNKQEMVNPDIFHTAHFGDFDINYTERGREDRCFVKYPDKTH